MDNPMGTAGNAPAHPMWLAVAGLMIAIFVADTATPIEINFAMLYVAPLLLAARFARPAGIIATALLCAVLAAGSFAILFQPITGQITTAVNLLIALATLTVTTIITLQGWRSDQRLREQANLLDLTHDTIFVRGMDDVIRYWNRGAEELYGWPAELAVGRVSHELLRTRFPVPLESINRELAETGRWEGELTHARRDGSNVVVASRWSLQRDHAERPLLVLETNNDVTLGRRAEYLTAQVFDTVPDPMCIIGADYRVQRANPAYARNHRRTPETVVGEHVADLNGQLFERTIEPRLRRCLAGENVVYGGWWNDAAGRRYFRVSYSPLKPSSEAVEAVLMVAHDLTEQMLAWEAVRAGQADLAHANRVMTMGQLTASIAHEVNQPIHAIALSARAAIRWLAADPPQREEAENALSRVVHNAALAGDVLKRIRNLVKKAPPQLEAVKLGEAVRDVLALAATEAEKNGVKVEAQIAPELPPILGDHVRLQQVILNLVMNAIEAMSVTDEGRRNLSIRAEAKGDTIVVLVSDSGPGMSAETVQRLFEPFFTTKPQGMGMGLAICRSIVEAHGGSLSATPNEPCGTTFQFSLPVASQARTAANALSTEETEPDFG